MPDGKHRLVGYQMPRSNRYVIRIVIATILMTLAILAILPFTQALSGDPRDRTLRSVQLANIPPPEPPPPEPPPPPEEEEVEVEDFEEPPPPLDLRSLEAALNPGIGSAGAGLVSMDLFEVRPDAAGEMQIFEIGDLDRVPRRLSGINPPYPRDMQRQRIMGEVRLILVIDETGSVRVQEVQKTPHPGFVEPVVNAVNTWKFEPPVKDGQRVKARYILPLNFSL
ncbi:MAG: energy transducer TonB [Oceanipulchritudo sp.]